MDGSITLNYVRPKINSGRLAPNIPEVNIFAYPNENAAFVNEKLLALLGRFAFLRGAIFFSRNI